MNIEVTAHTVTHLTNYTNVPIRHTVVNLKARTMTAVELTKLLFLSVVVNCKELYA